MSDCQHAKHTPSCDDWVNLVQEKKALEQKLRVARERFANIMLNSVHTFDDEDAKEHSYNCAPCLAAEFMDQTK